MAGDTELRVLSKVRRAWKRHFPRLVLPLWVSPGVLWLARNDALGDQLFRGDPHELGEGHAHRVRLAVRRLPGVEDAGLDLGHVGEVPEPGHHEPRVRALGDAPPRRKGQAAQGDVAGFDGHVLLEDAAGKLDVEGHPHGHALVLATILGRGHAREVTLDHRSPVG